MSLMHGTEAYILFSLTNSSESLDTDNYPDWMLTIPKTKSASRDSEESVNGRFIGENIRLIDGITNQTAAHNISC